MATTALCCVSRKTDKYSNEAGYEVYTISEDQLRLKQKMKDRKEGVHVEYVTSRLIAMSCTAETSERKFVESLLTASQQVQKAHNKHVRVWNVSQRRHDVSSSLDAIPFGWPAETAPPLEKLCTICKNLDQWMLEHPLNVAIIFCKGGLERCAVVVNAFMRYNAISATDDSVEDRFTMQRFSERFLGPDGSPSYKRYLTYFSSLLSGRISVSSEPLYLHQVILSHFQPINVFLKIYERLLPVYQSRTVPLKDVIKFEIEGTLKLRGDIFLKCIIAASSPGSASRCLFTCQLNTCALELQPINSEGYSIVKLHKEELDLIFNDKKIDNRVSVQLIVSHTKGPTTIAEAAVQSVTNLLPRHNSYETFEVAQDEETNRAKLEVEYSTIKKKNQKALKGNNETEEEVEEMPVGPPVPPKPATPIHMNGGLRAGEYGAPNGTEGGEVVERRGILPASLREKINQKKELEGRATPSIEPDLVGRDRYDKASRCFSYVPAKSMQEAFERPRRTSFSRAIEKRENSVENVSQEEVARTAIPHSQHVHEIVAPTKWDEQVEDAKQAALLEELARAPSSRDYYSRGAGADYQQPYEDDNVQVVDQAQRAVVTPTSTLQRRGRAPARAGSYRTLNDDAYCSDMDELCDPEYYLNFNNSSPPAPPPRGQHAGARSVQLPRKKMNFDAMTDPLDDVLESTKRLGSAYSVGDVRQVPPPPHAHNDFNEFAKNLSNTLQNSPANDVRQHYRNRNCQSVTTPRNGFTEPPPSDADSWLSGKLKKVRSKRDIDPDIVRRRTQEKMLLEELKDSRAVDDENAHRVSNGNGQYRSGGAGGLQNVDPLAEFRREEERLRNTRSPYGDERWRGRMCGKPPTPPPRESSASPVNARATPSSHLESSRQRHNQSVPLSMHHRQFDEDFDVNSLLNFSHDNQNTLDRGRSLSRGARIQDAYYASQQDLLPNRFYSGQERVAAAIYRAETPHRDMYASGTINRAETPGRYFPENSAVLERAATPSFPVSRATPLPFHPLLYNNGERQQQAQTYQAGGGGGHNNGYSTMNNRSASPRLFGGSSTLSRRSSMNSVGRWPKVQ
ncbi:unnamed protein product [Caenorhabditis sp. 36 PRJEB53466]|nr:unnamed protein product [Caenorhabditis sp. 36 PRJEB53466]